MIKLGQGAALPQFRKSEERWKLDKYGDGPGEVRKPLGICFLPDGNIVFSDKYQVKVVSKDGQHMATLGKNKVDPRGVACTKYSEVVVADADNACIHLFDPRGRGSGPLGDGHIRSFGHGLFTYPCGVAVSEDNTFFITDTKGEFISIHDYDGTQIRQIEYANCPSLANPVAIATSKKGHFYVSDEYDSSIKVFSLSGELMKTFTGFDENLSNGFSHQSGISVDALGNLIVCDTGNHRVTMLDPNGRVIKHLLTMDIDHIYEPWDVAVDNEGHIALTFWEGCKVAYYNVFEL